MATSSNSDSSRYSRSYSRALRSLPLRYGRKIPVESMHPDLAFSRLGAHLRKAAEADDDIGRLSAAVVTNADHEGRPRPSEPLELTPLHALRDAVLDSPEHPLASAFNWERLPEKVAFDADVRDRVGHGDAADYLAFDGRVATAPIDRHFHEQIRPRHPWATTTDLRSSLHRLNDQDFARLSTEQWQRARAVGHETAPDAVHNDLRSTIRPSDDEHDHHQRY